MLRGWFARCVGLLLLLSLSACTDVRYLVAFKVGEVRPPQVNPQPVDGTIDYDVRTLGTAAHTSGLAITDGWHLFSDRADRKDIVEVDLTSGKIKTGPYDIVRFSDPKIPFKDFDNYDSMMSGVQDAEFKGWFERALSNSQDDEIKKLYKNRQDNNYRLVVALAEMRLDTANRSAQVTKK